MGSLLLALMSLPAVLVATLGQPAAASAIERNAVLYSDATIIDGTGAPARVHQDILVRGERIAVVAPHSTIRDVRDVRRVDVAGRFIIPGLIDSHVHLATPPNVGRAKAVLRRDLYGGVTAVRDMADDLRPVGELAREALADEIPSPDIYFAAVMAGPPFFQDPRVGQVSFGVKPGTAPWMQAIDDKTDIRTAVTLARGTSATAIKIYADLPVPLVEAIAQEAHRQNMLVWAHGAVFPARPSDVIAAGADVVSHVCYLAYQAEPDMPSSYEDRTPVHEERLALQGNDPTAAGLYTLMLRKGTILDATGGMIVRYDAERRSHPERPPMRCTGATTIRLTRQAWKAGVPISTGTDEAYGYDHDWPEVDDELIFLVRDVGMPPIEVIRSATSIGAKAAGQYRDMGSIEPGKLANFVVLRADPLADIDNIRSIDRTVKRGKAYPRSDYRPTTLSEMGSE